MSRQGSWGSGELRAGRTQSLGAYDTDSKGSLPPLCKNQSAGSNQALGGQQTCLTNHQKACDNQSFSNETLFKRAPVSSQTSLLPSHCVCSSTASSVDIVKTNSQPPLVTRKPNRICNCFRRNSDGEAQGSGVQDAYILGSADSNTVAYSKGLQISESIEARGQGRSTGDSGENSTSNSFEGNCDSRVADSRGTKSGYDSEQIMAATSCISSVILRKKFIPPATDLQCDSLNNLHAPSCLSNQSETGKPLESVHRQGNSTFYVNNENVSPPSHRGSSDSQLTTESHMNIRNSHVGYRGSLCDNTNLAAQSNAPLSLTSRESNVHQHTVFSNTLVVSVPPSSRPLSQTLFNYSNSYPQPFSSQSKLKNNQLSRSYPSVLGQSISVAKKSTGCDERPGSHQSIGCDERSSNRRSTGSTCIGERNPSQPFCDKTPHSESQGQVNLNRVAMTTSTQSLNNASTSLHAGRECPKRSLSVEEKRGKKMPSPGGVRKENSYGIVKNLKHEFEAKNGNSRSQSSLNAGFQHKRNHSSSSCCSCGNETGGAVEGRENSEQERYGQERVLDNSALIGEPRNINNLCDGEDEVFRSQTSAHEDNSNNNEVPRSVPNVDDFRISSSSCVKLPVVKKNVPRNPSTSQNPAIGQLGISPSVISATGHKKSVRNIVGKFEQKSDSGDVRPKSTVVVDSVTNFIKYIDDIKTKREEESLVGARVLVDTHGATVDATSGTAPPIYNTM